MKSKTRDNFRAAAMFNSFSKDMFIFIKSAFFFKICYYRSFQKSEVSGASVAAISTVCTPLILLRNKLLSWPPVAYCSYRVTRKSVRLLKVEMC